MRRSHYLIFILLLIAQTSFGQIYQNMAQPGYKFSRARFDSVLTIPTGLGGLRNITGGQDTGQIRFNVSDSSVYVWNGRGWIKAGGGGSGSIDYVTQGYGIKVDSSGRVYTVRVDSTIVGSKTYIDAKDALKLNISDTAAMLTPYAKTAELAAKLNISDTASMLSAYARSAAVTSALALKLNITDTIGNGDLFIRNVTTQENKRFNVKGGRLDTLYASTSAGGRVVSNGGTITAEWGAGGGDNFDFHGFAGYNANRASSYTTRSFTDKNYVDSSLLLKTTVTSYGKNAGGDSTILLLSNGTRYAAKDSLGGGNIYTTDGSLTAARTLTLNSYPLTITGTQPNRFHANGNITFGPTSSGGVPFSDSSYKLSLVADNLNFLRFKRNAAGADLLQFTSAPDLQTARIYAGSFLHIAAANSIAIGGTGRVTLGANLSDGLTPVSIGYESWRSMAASAILDIRSSTQGILIPRMTATQRNAISSPATGLQVYNTDANTFDYYNGATWGAIGRMAIGGSITSATAGSLLFAGTSGVLAQDNANLFWNNTNKRLGIGTTNPTAPLDIAQSQNESGELDAFFIQDLSDIQANFTLKGGTGSTDARIKLASLSPSLGGAIGSTAIITNTNHDYSLFFPLRLLAKNVDFEISASNYASRITAMRIESTGSVGIGTTSPNASSLLDVTSTTKGILFPRMTTSQKNAIASPAAGLVVYDTTLNKLCVRTASAWETITSL